MRIGILTQYYPPEHGAPQNRLHDMASRLAKHGVETVVLTAMPNYPKGRVFDGYRGRVFLAESIDGIKVLRSYIFASKNKGTLTQLTVYFSFVISSLFAGAFKFGKLDFLICESPPLFLGFTALVLKAVIGAKLVMNISDLWPESAVQLGMIGPGPALTALQKFEALLYKSSAFVSCQTEGIVDGVKKAAPGAETFLFPNGADTETYKPLPKSEHHREEFGLPKDKLIVGYAGNHGRSQALEQILEAAKIIGDESVFFALFGDGPEKESLIRKAEADGIKNLRFYPSQPRQRIPLLQSQFDISVVPLKNIELFNGARPSKMFELMSGGVPFVFCGRGEGAELAQKSGCALVCGPEEPEKLKEKILELLRAPAEKRAEAGQKGRAFVKEFYDREKIAADFHAKLISVQGKT